MLNWAPRHEGVLGELRYSSTHSLTSAIDGGEWSASCPGRFTPRERSSGTHWIRGWVGPRAILDAVVKRKIPSPRRESNPRNPIFQPVAQRYTDWAIAAPKQCFMRVENSTGTVFVHGEMKILTLLNMSVIHRRSLYEGVSKSFRTESIRNKQQHSLRSNTKGYDWLTK
jgi:hypothetical protein